MGVPVNIEDIEKNFIEAIDSIWCGEIKYEYLLERTNSKQSYFAVVSDNEGYKYKYSIGQIKSKMKKGIIKQNIFAKDNYLQYIHNHFENIIVDKFDYVDYTSKIYYHCTKHPEYGTQETLAKHICKPNKKFMCVRCAQEHTGECNKINEDEIIQTFKNQNCEYINSEFLNGSKRMVQFRCNKHFDKIQYRPYSGIKYSKTPCLYCNKELEREITLGSLEDIYNSPRFNREKIEILGEYINDSTKLLCQCNYCNHQWYVTPNKLKHGRGCPNCAHIAVGDKFRKTHEQAQKDISQKYPTIKMLGRYVNCNSKIDFKCLTCGTVWTAKYKDVFKGGTGCPHCRSSIGEFNIATYLNDNNINYIRQHYFPDCKNEEPLRFDFYLPDYNTVIEFQGEQHYFPVNFTGHWSKEELDKQFEYTKLRDNIKRKYCKSQGIQMVEIPYWDKNKVNLYLDDVI